MFDEQFHEYRVCVSHCAGDSGPCACLRKLTSFGTIKSPSGFLLAGLPIPLSISCYLSSSYIFFVALWEGVSYIIIVT